MPINFMKHINLDQCHYFKKLKENSTSSFSEILNQKRIESYQIKAAGLLFSYAATSITESALTLLKSLALEQDIFEKHRLLRHLEPINFSENKAVSHHQVRKDFFYSNEALSPILEFAQSTSYSDIIQIGIGGSILGPKAFFHALSNCVPTLCNWHFISNIDPQEAFSVLKKVNLKNTLFIFASKSGTTIETIENYRYISTYCQDHGIQDFSSQAVSITTPGSPMDDENRFFKRFYFPDTVGGRFSLSSTIGALMMVLVFGSSVFLEFLSGALDLDENAFSTDFNKNISLMAALVSIWHFHILSYSSSAIVPYSYAFSYLPELLQQLFCESLGKSFNVHNGALPYVACPIVFGDIGTNAQHSFFQLLHQGNQVVPIHFLGIQGNHPLLNKNLVAQMTALSMGSSQGFFPGNKPFTLLMLDSLTPKVLGALLAFYENWVMFESFLVNVNAFDQPGVELAKGMIKAVDQASHDSLLYSFYRLIQ